MTIEEKLQHFMEVSVNTAAIKSQNMVNQYKAGMDKILEDHKAEALKAAETYKKTEKDGINRNSSKEFARHQQHIKRKLTHKHDELKEKLFAEVLTILNDYKKTPEYDELLVKYIKESLAVAKNESLDIYIDPEDSDKLETLKAKTGANIKISDYSFMGGVRAAIPSKNILIDNSFESKYRNTKEEYIINM